MPAATQSDYGLLSN